MSSHAAGMAGIPYASKGRISAHGLYPVPHYNLAAVICNWVSGKHFYFIFPWFLWKPIPQPLPSECRNHSRAHKWEVCPFSVLAKCLLHLHYIASRHTVKMLHTLGDPACSSGVVYALLGCIFQDIICYICQLLHVKLIYVHDNVQLSSVV